MGQFNVSGCGVKIDWVVAHCLNGDANYRLAQKPDESQDDYEKRAREMPYLYLSTEAWESLPPNAEAARPAEEDKAE